MEIIVDSHAVVRNNTGVYVCMYLILCNFITCGGSYIHQNQGTGLFHHPKDPCVDKALMCSPRFYVLFQKGKKQSHNSALTWRCPGSHHRAVMRGLGLGGGSSSEVYTAASRVEKGPVMGVVAPGARTLSFHTPCLGIRSREVILQIKCCH